ncbi:aryl-sulfate sulfotransferase [candidate division WOR-3 bacterium]|nr:aryl-sulfate sulfotransferase [candidate division WOR-3 bacterium]
MSARSLHRRPNGILAVGLLALGIGRLVPAQPQPWRHPDGSIHYYCAVADSHGVAWDAAADSAEKLGGYLVTLTSGSENDFVYGLVDCEHFWQKRPGLDVWAGPWLGARQRVGAAEPDSGWEWVTGEPFAYTNWSSGQPDDDGDQDALNLGESPCSWLPTWNDVSSLDSCIHSFVIELSAESTTIGLLDEDSSADVGYTLFQPDNSRSIFLIDGKGRYVHSWYDPYLPALSNYLLADGSLLHTGFLGNPSFFEGGNGGRVSRLDWEGNLVWAFEYSNDDHCLHHDIQPLPNGNILMIAWEKKTRAEAIAAGRDPAWLWDAELWPDHIVEVHPADNTIVWEWHVWDHLIQDSDSTKANYGVVADHPELVDINYVSDGYDDWLHTNSIDYHPQFDQILLSIRDLSEVWVIDHSTTTEEAGGHSGGRCGMGGDLLYRWGNPGAYRAGSLSDQRFFGQHDARWVEPGLSGAGRIMVFNNGLGRPDVDYSTVEEFIPACDSAGIYARPAPGTPFGPAAPCWTWGSTPPADFYSEYKSSALRLPNGNTLICRGDNGYFFEITPDSQTVWRYVNPAVDSTRLFQGDTARDYGWFWKENATFRITRYAPDYPGLLHRDLTPDFPLERYRRPFAYVNEERPRPVPPRLSVSPNPFRSSVSIALAPCSHNLSQSAIYNLESAMIYDASGRLVRTLSLPAHLAPGPAALSWDALDASGRRCPPGVYLCRATASGLTATAKLLLGE